MSTTTLESAHIFFHPFVTTMNSLSPEQQQQKERDECEKLNTSSLCSGSEELWELLLPWGKVWKESFSLYNINDELSDSFVAADSAELRWILQASLFSLFWGFNSLSRNSFAPTTSQQQHSSVECVVPPLARRYFSFWTRFSFFLFSFSLLLLLPFFPFFSISLLFSTFFFFSRYPLLHNLWSELYIKKFFIFFHSSGECVCVCVYEWVCKLVKKREKNEAGNKLSTQK